MSDSQVAAAGVFAAVDVCYLRTGARAALAAAVDPLFSSIAWSTTALIATPGAYVAGEFWRRRAVPHP